MGTSPKSMPPFEKVGCDLAERMGMLSSGWATRTPPLGNGWGWRTCWKGGRATGWPRGGREVKTGEVVGRHRHRWACASTDSGDLDLDGDGGICQMGCGGWLPCAGSRTGAWRWWRSCIVDWGREYIFERTPMFGQWMEGVDKTLVHFVLFLSEVKRSHHETIAARDPPSLGSLLSPLRPLNKKRPGLGLTIDTSRSRNGTDIVSVPGLHSIIHSIDLPPFHPIPAAASLSIAHSLIPPEWNRLYISIRASAHLHTRVLLFQPPSHPLRREEARDSSITIPSSITTTTTTLIPGQDAHARGLLTCRTAPLIEKGCLPACRIVLQTDSLHIPSIGPLPFYSG